MSDSGAWQAQGWPRQEGRPQEGPVSPQQEDLTPIYTELLRRYPAMGSEICTICNRPSSAHEGDDAPRHAFTPPGSHVDTGQFGVKASEQRDRGNDPRRIMQTPQGLSQTPIDPILRLALVDAGVITPEDLEKARLKMEMMNSNVLGVSPARGTGPNPFPGKVAYRNG